MSNIINKIRSLKNNCMFAIILLLCCLSLSHALAQEVKNKASRHIVVAFDVSRSMWSHLPRRHRKKILQRVHAVLAEILFTSDRVIPSQGDDIPIPGKLPRPLLRSNDFLTLHLFGGVVQSPLFQHHKRSQLSQRFFLEKLPGFSRYWRTMKARHSLISEAKLRGLRYLDEYPAENHYFILVSDDVSDGGGKRGRLFRKYQESKRKLELMRKDKRDTVLFSFRIHKHISIRVYTLKSLKAKPIVGRPRPPKPVVIKVVLSKSPEVKANKVIQQVEIRSPQAWKKHKLSKVSYIISHKQKQLLSQSAVLSKKQQWPYMLPIAIPRSKLRGMDNGQIHMRLQFTDPEKK